MTEHIEVSEEEYNELVGKDRRENGVISWAAFSVGMIGMGLSIGLGTLAATHAQTPFVAWGWFFSVAVVTFGLVCLLIGAVGVLWQSAHTQERSGTVDEES